MLIEKKKKNLIEFYWGKKIIMKELKQERSELKLILDFYNQVFNLVTNSISDIRLII